MSNPFHFEQDLVALVAEIPEDSIVSRTFYKGDQNAIVFGFAAGQELSEHTAARPAILHVLRGKGRVTLGDASFAVETGSWAHMDAHLPHSVVAETELVMLLLLV